ncbi:recombinase family protein [Novosphingobium rosa]
MKAGDTLVVWKLGRVGRSLTNLLAIITDLKNRGVASRSLTEQMDTSATFYGQVSRFPGQSELGVERVGDRVRLGARGGHAVRPGFER